MSSFDHLFFITSQHIQYAKLGALYYIVLTEQMCDSSVIFVEIYST